MKHIQQALAFSTVAVTLALATPALAGGSAGSIGVGADLHLSGLSGVSVNYDAGMFHAGGMLALQDEEGADNTDITLGGRFFYHLHAGQTSDFSVGGNLGLAFIDGAGDGATLLFIEPAFQARAFIANNVALSFTGGIVLGAADAGGLAITSQVNAGAGVHYYFF